MALSPAAALNKDTRNAKSEMQHRHFATVAAIIRSLELLGEHHETVVRHFALHLRDTNPKFNRDRFVAAARKEV